MLGNVCPICESVLADLRTVRHHLQRAVRNSRCIIGFAKYGYEIRSPPSLQCPFDTSRSLEPFESLSGFNFHLSSEHLRIPLDHQLRYHGRSNLENQLFPNKWKLDWNLLIKIKTLVKNKWCGRSMGTFPAEWLLSFFVIEKICD